MRGAVALPGSETISRRKGTRRNLGDLAWPAVAKAIPGRDGKARSQSRRGAGEESDGLVVPMKRSNKPVLNGGGGRGGKGPGRREGGRQCMLRTPSRASHVPGVVRLRIGAAGAAQLGMPITSDLRQEPGAGKPHAGICAGGGWQQPSLPRPPQWSRKVAKVAMVFNGRGGPARALCAAHMRSSPPSDLNCLGWRRQFRGRA